MRHGTSNLQAHFHQTAPKNKAFNSICRALEIGKKHFCDGRHRKRIHTTCRTPTGVQPIYSSCQLAYRPSYFCVKIDSLRSFPHFRQQFCGESTWCTIRGAYLGWNFACSICLFSLSCSLFLPSLENCRFGQHPNNDYNYSWNREFNKFHGKLSTILDFVIRSI